MALAFHLLVAVATPSLVVSPIASPIPALPTSGGLNVLPILLAVLVVILLILILALRLGGRRQDSEEPDLEQHVVPAAPRTPDDGVNPQEREIYRAQSTPFATQPAPAAAETPAPVPYQPPPPDPAVPQQPRPLPPPDPALYQPPTYAPTAYPTTTLAPWATSPPGPAAPLEPAPARVPLTTPEPFPPPIPSTPAPEPEPTAIDAAPGAMDPLPPPATSFAFPPAPTTTAPPVPPVPPAPPAPDLASVAPAAPPVIPRPEPAPAVSPEPIPIPGPEATPIPPQPALPEPSVPAPMAPQAAEPAAAVPAAPAPTPAGGAVGGQLILLIEDDERIAKFYTILFEAKGYLVRNARDGIEGVDLATALKPALILLDVMMPKMNGLMVLQTLRANPETEHTPVVVLSNYMEPPLIQRALQLGAIEYVIKSQARPEQLVNAVPSWLIGEPALH